MSHLPRNGRYELFTYAAFTYCFDDLSFEPIKTPPGMFEWIRSQDPSLWTGPDLGYTNQDVAVYLQPELYTLWKLKWA